MPTKTTMDKFTPTHILYKGTSLEEEVMLIKYCNNPSWAVINYKHSNDNVKIMTINLTPIIVEQKKSVWAKIGKYVLENIPLIISIITRKKK